MVIFNGENPLLMGKSTFLMGKSTINGHFQWGKSTINGKITIFNGKIHHFDITRGYTPQEQLRYRPAAAAPGRCRDADPGTAQRRGAASAGAAAKRLERLPGAADSHVISHEKNPMLQTKTYYIPCQIPKFHGSGFDSSPRLVVEVRLR